MAEKKKFTPTWLYHPKQGARLFKVKQLHDTALEDGWVDTPAKLAKKSPDAMDYAVVKEGRRRAIRVFDTREEAEAYIADMDDATGVTIEERPR